MRMLQLRTDTWLSAAVSPGINTGPGLTPSRCSYCWAPSRHPAAVWRTRGGRIGQSNAAPSAVSIGQIHIRIRNTRPCLEKSPGKKLDCLEVIISMFPIHLTRSLQSRSCTTFFSRIPAADPALDYGLDSNSQMAQPCERLSSFILLPWYSNFIVSSRNRNSADGFTEIRKFRKEELSFYWIKKHESFLELFVFVFWPKLPASELDPALSWPPPLLPILFCRGYLVPLDRCLVYLYGTSSSTLKHYCKLVILNYSEKLTFAVGLFRSKVPMPWKLWRAVQGRK